MGFFNSTAVKKPLSLLEDGDFIVIQTKVKNLELELEKIRSHMISLRGFVNRQIQTGNIPETETIKSTDGLDSLR